MKKTAFLNSKTILVLFITLLFATTGFAQDTLHLNYVALQPKMPDSTEAKITAWVKKLNGQHVNVQILAYYNQSEFKKYSVERSEEVNLIILRKARDLVTITKNEVKKGAKSQRSKVDIVYIGGPGTSITKEATITKKEEKTTSNEAKNETTPTETKKEEAASNTVVEPVKPVVQDGYIYDSVYVNGVLKVTKKKVKKK